MYNYIPSFLWKKEKNQRYWKKLTDRNISGLEELKLDHLLDKFDWSSNWNFMYLNSIILVILIKFLIDVNQVPLIKLI